MAEQRHESQEPDLRGVLVAGAIVSAFIVIAVGVCLWLVALFGGSARPLARAEHNPMPQPHLQPHPLADRQRYEAQERAKLSGYAWVDRSSGIVRIPIDRAMQILAQQHGSAGASQESSAPAPQAPVPKERKGP
jgi:hypothetical protein